MKRDDFITETCLKLREYGKDFSQAMEEEVKQALKEAWELGYTKGQVMDVKNDELILRIPLDELDKIQYALNHVWLTGDEHIDATLATLNEVLKEERAKK